MKVEVPTDSSPSTVDHSPISTDQFLDASEYSPHITKKSASMDVDKAPQIQRDASFGKWDGESYTWTPHYQLLQVQCEVYLPFLVTEKAVCMKIYESIPEPQRQRIRGYWIKCGKTQEYSWKAFLNECNKTYYSKVESEKAENKLYSMKQGESQFFRSFLEEWELQLEYAGGSDWPESFKIKQLRRSISEKLSDKIVALKLPKDDYQKWVEEVADVASNIEIRENFLRKGESRITQSTIRSTVQKNRDQPTSATSINPQSSPPLNIDGDGDFVMGGMKIDIKLLTSMISALNSSNEKKNLEVYPSPSHLHHGEARKKLQILGVKGYVCDVKSLGT